MNIIFLNKKEIYSLGEAIAFSKVRKSKTFIIKPETGCQGRGIYLTKNLKDIKPYDRLICQVYLSKVRFLSIFENYLLRILFKKKIN